ncbi:serine/threonine-protein phosphatase 2A regulatory subunit B'' subunit beta [Neomonachus schauinslandi]|uniref:Serine/threonine-protein phosphatase 2A regulatory subunit B'' subunit beta n=1 Tax=Neomonachus schauinslandi TaxID=29088 RepID=A0A8M1M132_NEOSC|nr:serine/threonine-protein phosphatase 2A regulatory subunit B'' subunit beta [Neomonachus schauinslandi]
MPPGKVLQPVLKMKVDELFLCWLSESSTQTMLQDCLQRIKMPGRTETGGGDAGQPGPPLAAAASACKPAAFDSLGAPSPAPASTALPLGAATSPRTGPPVRGTRRSAGTRVVSFASLLLSRVRGDLGLRAQPQQLRPEWLLPAWPGACGEERSPAASPTLQPCALLSLWNAPGPGPAPRAPGRPRMERAEPGHPDCPAGPSCHREPAGPGPAQPREREREHSAWPGPRRPMRPDMRLRELSLRQDPDLRQELASLARGCDFVLPSRFKKRLQAFQQVQNVALLEEEADINQLTEYFSYEHFYVIYCKFWELDTDHDLLIDSQDLARHNDHAVSTKMIERIFSGAVTRGRKVQKEGRISYADFVWFLISEEDKKTPTSIEYWFRCMDLDGDGALSMFELEYFYEEQCRRLDSMAIEALPFEDCLCQMLDLVKPQNEGKITLHDLKKCKLANVFFDTFFNIEKYLDHEQKEQVSLLRESESEGPELSDWEKYAAEEYDILVAEEAAGEPWEDGYEAELSPVDQKLSSLRSPLAQRPFFEAPSSLGTVELYEYACEDEDLQPS